MIDHVSIPWSIFNILPNPILVVNAQRSIILANRAARELLGPAIEGGEMAMALRHPSALSMAMIAVSGARPEPAEITIPGDEPQTFEVRAEPVPGNGEAQAVIILENTTSQKHEQFPKQC